MVSIVILNWNSIEDLTRCVSSIIENVKCKFEIIIVDNGSTDKSVEYIKNNFKSIKLIENKKNRGVAPARNQGISYARGEYILILDVDTILLNDAVTLMKEYMDNNRQVGILGAQLLNTDLSIQYSCRDFPTIFTKLASRLPIFQKKLSKELLKEQDHSKTIEVGYLLGACQFIRKDIINKIGVYDEKIFYGPEDLDYCVRAWLKGLKVVYYPKAKIIHNHKRITKKIFTRMTMLHAKALLYYFWKHKSLFSNKLIYKRIILEENWNN